MFGISQDFEVHSIKHLFFIEQVVLQMKKWEYFMGDQMFEMTT